MGVIKRQGIKRSIVNYVGVGLGVISTLFIYPLDLETYGFIQFLLGMAVFLGPFASFGMTSLAVRFFPDFKNDTNGHNGFLGFILTSIVFSFLVFAALTLFFQPYFYKGLKSLKFDVPLFSDNIIEILVLCFLVSITGALASYTSNFKRIVVPAIFNSLLVKIATPALILLLFYKIFPQSSVKPFLIALYILILIGSLFYLYSLGQLKFKINSSFFNRPFLAKMGEYAAYGVLGSIGGTIAFRIDSIMVSSLIDLKSNGIYTIALFMANAIAIPFISIATIASPIIANHWKNNDVKEISSIYKKSSLILLIIGLFFFLLVWSSLDDILRFTPRYEELILGKYVVLFLGLAKVIDMTTGLNNQIIGYSKLFRFNLIAVLLLAVINIVANYILIPKYHITGAAIATALSLVIFNLVKFIFIWIKFKMQPFTFTSFKVLILAIVAYGVVSFIPSTSSNFLNLIIKSSLICILFGLPILLFNISPDLTKMVYQGRDKALKWLRVCLEIEN